MSQHLLIETTSKKSDKLTFRRQHSVTFARLFLLLMQELHRIQSFSVQVLQVLQRFSYSSAGVNRMSILRTFAGGKDDCRFGGYTPTLS